MQEQTPVFSVIVPVRVAGVGSAQQPVEMGEHTVDLGKRKTPAREENAHRGRDAPTARRDAPRED
jgi:hypothetical protein